MTDEEILDDLFRPALRYRLWMGPRDSPYSPVLNSIDPHSEREVMDALRVALRAIPMRR